MNSLHAADLVSTAVFLSACLQREKPLRSLRQWGCNISQIKVNWCFRLIEYEFLVLISEGCSVQTHIPNFEAMFIPLRRQIIILCTQNIN